MKDYGAPAAQIPDDDNVNGGSGVGVGDRGGGNDGGGGVGGDDGGGGGENFKAGTLKVKISRPPRR
jgi:hypothetical protein